MFSAWRMVDRNARRMVENHGFDGNWRLESLLTMRACLSSREDRVVLSADRRGPSDFGGSVMSAERISGLSEKEATSMECSRRKERSVGRASDAGFIDSLVKTGKWLVEDQ